ERVNRVLVPIIMATIERHDQRDWDRKVREVERCLNNSVHRAMQKTPFEVVYGYRPIHHLGALRLVEIDGEPWSPPEELWNEVRNRLQDEQDKSKLYYDKRHYKAEFFNVGDLVFMQ